MDPVAIANAVVAASIAKAQLAVAARLAKSNAPSGPSVTALIEAANASMDEALRAALPSSMGVSVDTYA